MTDRSMDDTSVRVALRVRPQSAKERIDMCQICTAVTPGEPQLFLGKDKGFTYDFVFNLDSTQQDIYDHCARPLIEGTFEGYNATIFAYGQTGSGKTYTMGTGFDLSITPEEVGIIPRAVEHLFQGIDQRRNDALENNRVPPDFKVNAQFMELYNEEIIDLLDTTRDPSEKGRKSHIKIHEDAHGGIYTVGVTTLPVTSLQDTIQCLKTGSLSRSTASTNMNAQSSRSHAIFTLHIKQQRVVAEEVDNDKENVGTETINEFETLTAKFHFVDLAGSERLKRTGATGDRAKEGISINCGLLALGNVISALGDLLKKGSHVPYRDSKLTRLLQDSLGGNSRTLMIACVSPSDRDFVETLNTLKYANRARNIKNKVMVNQDKTSRQIAELRAQVMQLQDELNDYKQGKRMVDPDGVETFNDMFHENTMLQTENDNLRHRIKAMQATIDTLNTKNTELLAERAASNITNIDGGASSDEVGKLISGYIREIEELRMKLLESESMTEQMKRTSSRVQSRTFASPMTRSAGPMLGFELQSTPDDHLTSLISEAKKEIKHLKRKTNRSSATSQGEQENQSEEEKQDHESAEDKEKKTCRNSDEEDDAGAEDDVDDEDVEDDEDADEDDSSESDDDQESDELHANLADLSCEISIKERLIEELELSQKRLHTMKQQYEEKLLTLSERIKQTEIERDKVLGSIGSVETESSEKAKKIRDQYEKKLNDMQNELKKLQAAKKEHTKLMRNQAHYEKQLGSLQRELTDMKKTKVKLINQIKEDSQKNRQEEMKRNKEIAQLKKEQRKKDNMLKSLEIDKRNKELILKRKQEEVKALRQRQKPLSPKAAGRVGKYDRPKTIVSAPVPLIRRRPGSKFSPKQAKQKWDNVERNISSAIVKKQTLAHMERDMERWMKERVSLGKKLDKLMKKREKAAAENAATEVIKEIEDQLNSIKASITFVQENINDCQSNIMQMEETKDQAMPEPSLLFDSLTLEEAKYMLENFVNLSVSKGLFAAQKESQMKELLARLHQERVESTLQRDMLQYLIQGKVDIDIDDSLLRSREESDSEEEDSSGTTSPVDSLMMTETQFMPVNPLTANMLLPSPTNGGPPTINEPNQGNGGRLGIKARRKTATPEDLLYAGGPTGNSRPTSPLLPLVETEEAQSPKPTTPNKPTNGTPPKDDGNTTNPTEEKKQDVTLMPPPKTQPVKQPPTIAVSKQNGIMRQTSASGTTNNTRAELTPSPGTMRKSFPPPVKNNGAPPEPSPTMRRRGAPPPPPGSTGSLTGSLSRQSSIDTCTTDTTPPTSPVPGRRHNNRDENVFSRLTSQTKKESPVHDRGMIKPVAKLTKASPLVHTHTASGHSRAVLSVFATDEMLFSSSKDRTGKVWDLNTGQELLTLSGHPNNVVSIRYSEETSLVYTVSTYYIKVWDIRNGNKCIKTLTSSGMTSDGALQTGTTSRQVTCPPGETNINDIAVNSTGTVLYSAAGSTVRIWDLRGFKPVGKLSGGHQAAVMVLAVDDTDTAEGNICVVTGSKDHYIKVFEMDEDSTGVMTPKCNLEPPHYDGIQSLCLMGDLLFSGSRDMCIKKWNLAEQQLAQSINNAHKDWICGLDFMPGGNCLLSGCRGGIVKLWHIDTCSQVGEVKAHSSPINSITTNSCLIFTASNEGGIKIWEPLWDILPEYLMDSFT